MSVLAVLYVFCKYSDIFFQNQIERSVNQHKVVKTSGLYAKKHVLPYFFDLCQEKEWRLGIKHTSEC